MEYKSEEEHLQRADSPSGIEEIKADIAAHFVSGGVEDGSELNNPMHSTSSDATRKEISSRDSQLAQELEGMAARHEADGDEKFVRGVAGLEFAYAEEDADAE